MTETESPSAHSRAAVVEHVVAKVNVNHEEIRYYISVAVWVLVVLSSTID